MCYETYKTAMERMLSKGVPVALAHYLASKEEDRSGVAGDPDIYFHMYTGEFQ